MIPSDIGTQARILVGISDMKMSKRPDEILATYSLGSCVGVTMYDPQLIIGGLLHCLLPDSSSNPKRAAQSPFMFVDTGLELMIQEFVQLGSDKRRLIVKVAGAGRFLDHKNHFDIGKKNYTMLRKVLWKNKIMIKKEAVGGSIPRTMFLHMDTGTTVISSKGSSLEL